MNRSLLRCCLALCLLLFTVGLTAAEWRHPLYRDGGGWWRERIRIVVTNETPRAVEGQPATVRIGSATGRGRPGRPAGRGDPPLQRAGRGNAVCHSWAAKGPGRARADSRRQHARTARRMPPRISRPSTTFTSTIPTPAKCPISSVQNRGVLNADMEQGDVPADSGHCAGRMDSRPGRRAASRQLDQRTPAVGQTVPENGRRLKEPSRLGSPRGSSDIRIIGGAKYRMRPG